MGKPGALSSPNGDRVHIATLGTKTLGLSFCVSTGGEKLSNRLFLRCSGSSPGCTRLLPSLPPAPLFRRPLLAQTQRRSSETPSPSYRGLFLVSFGDSSHSLEVSFGAAS